MKRLGILICFILLVLAAIASANTYLIGLQKSAPENAKIAEVLGVQLLPSETVRFDNDNTFVRFKAVITGQTVLVVIPPRMSPDELMELLIKIRTAHSNGAADIKVVSGETFSQVKIIGKDGKNLGLNLVRLFQVAGADELVDSSGKISRFHLPTRRKFKAGSAYVTGGSHPEMIAEISRALGIPALPEEKLDLKLAQVFFVAPSVEPVNEELFRSLEGVAKIKARGATVHLITPYLPYARSDKVDQDGVTVTGRLIADLIESVGADSITFVRAHAPQSQGFFKIPSFQVMGYETIDNYLRAEKIDLVVAPDNGSQKSDTVYAKDLQVPIGSINKYRHPITGKTAIEGYSGPDPKNMVIALIDDETASGGTLAQAAEYLKSKGAARVLAVVTHLAGRAEKALNNPAIDKVIVTNTFPVEKLANDRLVVLSMTNEIVQSIRSLRVERQASESSCAELMDIESLPSLMQQIFNGD